MFNVTWKKHAVAKSAPSAVRIGDYVYVGGGYAKRSSTHNVQRYSISKDEWTLLPDCPTIQYGLASLNKELMVIGGHLHGVATNTVYTFRDGSWKHILPPMPTPRYLLSTTSHEDKIIIAAGGTTYITPNGEFLKTDDVEIYQLGKWYMTKRLPFPLGSSSITIMDSTCYIFGDFSKSSYLKSTVFSTLSSLIENAEPEDPRYSTVHPVKWDTFPCQHPLLGTAILEVSGLPYSALFSRLARKFVFAK